MDPFYSTKQLITFQVRGVTPDMNRGITPITKLEMLYDYFRNIGDIIGLRILKDDVAEAVFPAFHDCAGIVITPKYLKSSELKLIPYFYLGVVSEHIVQTC